MSVAAVDSRLASLPRKIALPMRELLAVGQLNEDVIDHVLDAAEMAGSPSKALGFAVGYLYLQMQGVPVKDVIRMARQQQRRVRLEWSARRWQDEHDRLSRAETLQRLGEQNVRYALDEVEGLLPPRFCGYLIRSSRRLGMEGLRQRHCVASYHSQIQAGYCAIASVFIAHERWTVQLSRTGDAKAPLRIAQIRSRFNKGPTLEVREAIHRELCIEFARGEAATPTDEAAKPRAYMENLRRILPVLRAHGVQSVCVSFDGSGDSGSIEDVNYSGAQIDGNALTVEFEVLNRTFKEGKWIADRVFEHKSLSAAIEAVTDDYLEETNVDWYNNDGGYGELDIDVVQGTVNLRVSVRFTESSTEYSSLRSIESGEELEE